MSATTRHHEGRTDSDTREFVAIDAPGPMTDAKLAQCRDPRGEVEDGERAVFAVAHQHGIVQDERRDDEYEAEAVLYLTADGEQAVERWVAGTKHDVLADVDRAFVVDVDELEDAGDGAQRFVPVVREHPEVDA